MRNAEIITQLQFSPEISSVNADLMKKQVEVQYHGKIAKRQKLLKKHPEMRIDVDAAQLRSIVDYDYFYCSPFSSVARGQAIKGSDIDGGLVITSAEAPFQAQMQFIETLRSQGFDVYHESEVQAAYTRSNAIFEKWNKTEREVGAEMPMVVLKAMRDSAKAMVQKIDFITWDDMLETDGEKYLPRIMFIYENGYSIE